MKPIDQIELVSIHGGEIQPLDMPPGWNPGQIAAQEAIAVFLDFWAHATQSLGVCSDDAVD